MKIRFREAGIPKGCNPFGPPAGLTQPALAGCAIKGDLFMNITIEFPDLLQKTKKETETEMKTAIQKMRSQGIWLSEALKETGED